MRGARYASQSFAAPLVGSPPQWVSARFIGKACTSFVAEDELALQMAVTFEEPNGRLA